MDYDDGDIAMFLDGVRPAEPRDEPDWKAFVRSLANRSSPLVPSPYLIVDDVFKTASESQQEAVFEDYRLRDIRTLSEWWSARTKSHHAWAHLCKVVSDSNPQRIALKENMSHG